MASEYLVPSWKTCETSMPRAAESGLPQCGQGSPGDDGDQVGPLVDGKIALGAGTGKVIIDLVGTTGPLLGLAQALVADQTNALGQVDRSDKAFVQTVGLELLISHHTIALAKDVLGLAIVELVIARDDCHDGLTLGVDECQRLARAVLGEAEELGNGLNGTHAGVSTLVSVPSPGPSVTTTLVLAASSSAAKPQSSQYTSDASPASASAMYSTEVSPPISPESATTGRALI